MHIMIEINDDALERLHRAVRACNMPTLSDPIEVSMCAALGLSARTSYYERLAATGYRYTPTSPPPEGTES